MTTRQVWLVFGQTGEYSDHRQWSVAAYDNQEAAARHADMCKVWEHKTFNVDDPPSSWGTKCPYDPNFSRDSTGTDWSVEGPFPLLAEPPEEVK